MGLSETTGLGSLACSPSVLMQNMQWGLSFISAIAAFSKKSLKIIHHVRALLMPLLGQ